MQTEGTPDFSRPKSRNYAGLYLVVRNEGTAAAHRMQQYSANILPRHLCWTAFSTFTVGMLCLLIK